MTDWKEALAMFDAIAADARVLPENAASALRAKATIRAHIEELERRVGEQFMEAQRLGAEALRQQRERLVEKLRAEAAERDARRYRWLRDRIAPEELTDEDVALFAIRTVGPIANRPADDDCLDDVDAAIDAAIDTTEQVDE